MMDFEFSLPLKFYHTYLENIPAPEGLSTPSRNLEKNKWKCFGPENQMRLTIKREGIYTIIKVTCNGQSLDYALVNSLGGRGMIQFCARRPCISCKYMVSSTHLKRFQVSFGSDADFSDANNRIINMGFVVVRAQAPPGNSHATIVPQYTQQDPLSSLDLKSHGNALSQARFVSDRSMDISEKFVPCTTAVRGLPSNVVQFEQSTISEKKNREQSNLDLPPFKDVMAVPSIVTPNCSMTNSGIELLASQPSRNFTIEKTKQADSSLGDRNASLESTKSISKHTPVQIPLLPNAPAPLIQFQVPQTPESAYQASASPSQISIPPAGPPSIHPFIPPATHQLGQEENKSGSNDKSLNLEKDNGNVRLNELKMSKKIIKRKLRDKKFLKWVSKVENVLREMVEKNDERLQ